jgi:hypothetical protein
MIVYTEEYLAGALDSGEIVNEKYVHKNYRTPLMGGNDEPYSGIARTIDERTRAFPCPSGTGNCPNVQIKCNHLRTIQIIPVSR